MTEEHEPLVDQHEHVALLEELSYAAQKWGHVFDDQNTLNDWVAYVMIYCSNAALMDMRDDPAAIRAQLIKAAGLCLNAAAHVRTERIAPRHYDHVLGRGRLSAGEAEVRSRFENKVGVESVLGTPDEAKVRELLGLAEASAQRLPDSDYTVADISDEATRYYTFGTGPNRYQHTIIGPKTLVFRAGGSTHRVIDADGVVHCVPAPGHQACVLTWVPKDPENPIQF